MIRLVAALLSYVMVVVLLIVVGQECSAETLNGGVALGILALQTLEDMLDATAEMGLVAERRLLVEVELVSWAKGCGELRPEGAAVLNEYEAEVRALRCLRFKAARQYNEIAGWLALAGRLPAGSPVRVKLVSLTWAVLWVY